MLRLPYTPRPIRLLALLLLYAVAQSNGIIVIVVARARTFRPYYTVDAGSARDRAAILYYRTTCSLRFTHQQPITPRRATHGLPICMYAAVGHAPARRERDISGAPDRGCLRTSTVDADGAVLQISHRSKPPRAMHLPTFA